MKPIIEPVSKKLLKKELRKEFFVRTTNKAGNEIYDLTFHDAPNVLREIGRLREESYRAGGGATGEELDLDFMDTMERPYHQIVVWNPEEEDIVGGYRYLCGSECTFSPESQQPVITSAHLFHYSDYFIHNYLQYTIELGRAFVQPKYQTRAMGIKSLFALDNTWDGLGAILYNHPEIKYFIGKVTIYPSYDHISRDLIYTFLRRYCFDKKGLFAPYQPIDICREAQEIADDLFEGNDALVNYHILQKAIRARGSVIPPMFSAYLNLTTKLQFFGNAINDELADVFETGIMICVDDIVEEKKQRHIGTYEEFLAANPKARRRKK